MNFTARKSLEEIITPGYAQREKEGEAFPCLSSSNKLRPTKQKKEGKGTISVFSLFELKNFVYFVSKLFSYLLQKRAQVCSYCSLNGLICHGFFYDCNPGKC